MVSISILSSAHALRFSGSPTRQMNRLNYFKLSGHDSCPLTYQQTFPPMNECSSRCPPVTEQKLLYAAVIPTVTGRQPAASRSSAHPDVSVVCIVELPFLKPSDQNGRPWPSGRSQQTDLPLQRKMATNIDVSAHRYAITPIPITSPITISTVEDRP